MILTYQEIDNRLTRFCTALTAAFPDWDSALIVSKVNQFYFTGTMQDALLILRRNGQHTYFVRRSFERAKLESQFLHILPMNSYRDAAQAVDCRLGNTYIEGGIVPYSMLERIGKHFQITKIGDLDQIVSRLRAVKSPFELHWITESGIQHHELLVNDVPKLLREGMTEAELVGETFACMSRRGYQGLTRFSMFQNEIVIGQIGFGENSLFPTSFNGPGGSKGSSPGTPFGGDPRRKLKKGDLVFVDIGFGINGYHSDKTQVYMFGAKPDSHAVRIQQACASVQQRAAAQLIPGAVPSQIYQNCLDSLPDVLRRDFMGYGSHHVKFLGHGVGLYIDEYPVIAKGFDDPLEEDMVLALEPKMGVSNLGMLGVEDTYIVTPDGGRCITGSGRDIIVV